MRFTSHLYIMNWPYL